VTGDAEYTDDTPTPPNTLYAALVLSKKAHARILSIDDSLAKSSPGFAGLFLSKYIPGVNHTGPIIHDEEFFASNIVTCVGQIIGIVVADTHDNAKTAANKVHIEYCELPAILSIEEAVKVGSFHPNTKKCLVKGDVEQCFLSGACDKIVSGQVHVGGKGKNGSNNSSIVALYSPFAILIVPFKLGFGQSMIAYLLFYPYSMGATVRSVDSGSDYIY
ncbi:hypothetical protein ACJX0J_039616, partial [Zea mays]